MQKILITPSWYPLNENRLPGFFFREQALLLKDEFDFRILYGKQKPVNILLAPFYFFCRTNQYFHLHTPPEGTGFYFLQIRDHKLFRIFSPIMKIVDWLNCLLMIKQCRREVSKILKENWIPDLIHAHSTNDGGIIAHALSEQLSVPFIITEHQVFIPGLFTAFKRKLIKKSLEAANNVLAVSEHQKRQILMNDIACSPIVVGNFVDENVFCPQNLKQEVEGTFKILFVSYNLYIKDNDTFFKALKCLNECNTDDFKVFLVGGDYMHPEHIGNENPLFKLAKKHGVSEFVETLNFINREDMSKYYNKCDVLVSTSIAETFGVAQVEAMMCGKPVIATSNGGIDDFISIKNGIKIPIQDYRALADAMVKIKNKEIIFEKEEIRNSVINKYGRAAFSERLKTIYKNTAK